MLKLIYDKGTSANQRYLTGLSHITDKFLTIVDEHDVAHVYLGPLEFGAVSDTKGMSGKTVVINSFEEVGRGIEGAPLDLPGKIVNILNSFKGEKQVLVDDTLPLSIADRLRENGFALELTLELIHERREKSQTEIECIESALVRNEKGFALIEKILKASVVKDEVLVFDEEILTSETLKKKIKQELFKEGLYFIEGMIVAVGEQGVTPHHTGAGPIRPNTPIVCDLFPMCTRTGYFADLTHTYVKGEPSNELRKMFEAVDMAKRLAIESIKPGVTGVMIHQVCVDTLANHGYLVGPEEGFTHSTGHGLGLELHEFPRLSAKNHEPLQVGNVVTVEPGLYYKKIGGVRLEDVVVVTDVGCRPLSHQQEQFIIR